MILGVPDACHNRFPPPVTVAAIAPHEKEMIVSCSEVVGKLVEDFGITIAKFNQYSFHIRLAFC
jgi:hypothetical protein